jgi:hypothetical protein
MKAAKEQISDPKNMAAALNAANSAQQRLDQATKST